MHGAVAQRRARAARGRLHERGFLVAITVVLLAACSSQSDPGGPSTSTSGNGSPPTASGSRFPSSIVVLGHSGTTGFDSDPAAPETDVVANSWATGTNPKIDSVYVRVLDRNPAVEGNVQNFGIDGSRVESLLDQEERAAAVTPTPDLVLVQSIDNDIRCDGTDARNYEPYRKTLTDVMDALTRDMPNATIFFVSQWADVKEYRRVVSSINPWHLTGAGPCDVVNADTGKLDKQREAYLQGIVDDYFAIVGDVCGQYPNCQTDGGAMQRMRLQKSDLAEGLDHLSLTGLRKMAAIAFRTLYP